MEIVGGGGTIDNLHVGAPQNIGSRVAFSVSWDMAVLIGQLQESFHSARGVLWTVSVETVRKEHNKTALHVPLGLARAEELINDNLSSVCEISKLGFPKAQGIWVGLGVSEFVTEDGKLRQMRVGSDETSDCSLWDYIV